MYVQGCRVRFRSADPRANTTAEPKGSASKLTLLVKVVSVLYYATLDTTRKQSLRYRPLACAAAYLPFPCTHVFYPYEAHGKMSARTNLTLGTF